MVHARSCWSRSVGVSRQRALVAGPVALTLQPAVLVIPGREPDRAIPRGDGLGGAIRAAQVAGSPSWHSRVDGQASKR